MATGRSTDPGAHVHFHVESECKQEVEVVQTLHLVMVENHALVLQVLLRHVERSLVS